jgi:hypothetical protein
VPVAPDPAVAPVPLPAPPLPAVPADPPVPAVPPPLPAVPVDPAVPVLPPPLPADPLPGFAGGEPVQAPTKAAINATETSP